MFHWLKGALALFALSSSVAFAADCGDVRLDVSTGDFQTPFDHIPVYDQNPTGTCFAHSAAVMIDYWRASRGETLTRDNLTHPLHLAVSTRDRLVFAWDQTAWESLDTGSVSEIFDRVEERGVCRSGDVSAALARYRGSMDETEYVAWLEEVHAKMNRELRDGFRRIDLDGLLGTSAREEIEIFRRLMREFSASCGEIVPSGPANADLADHLLPLLRDIASEDINTLYRSIMEEDCGERRMHPEVPDLETFGARSTDAEIGDYLKAQLAREGAQPLRVGHCARVLESADPSAVEGLTSRAGRRWPKGGESECGAHAGLVVGMRKQGEKCQFLVRNSWGRRCGPYPAWDCTAGSVWVDEEDLTRNTFDIAHFPGGAP